MRKKYQQNLHFLIGVQIFICIIIALGALFLANRIALRTEEILRTEALHMVNQEMRQRIAYVIASIEEKQKFATDQTTNWAEFLLNRLSGTAENQISAQLNFWSSNITKLKYGQSIKMLSYNKATQKALLFHDGKMQDITKSYKPITDTQKAVYPVFRTLVIGNTQIYLFTEQEVINDIVKSYIHETIHAAPYPPDSYIWINEVINFDGGENYAIRRIHPNLKNTEGAYLNTTVSDGKGNYPYQTELNAIKKDGEALHTFYFPSKSDKRLIEKVSYAKLYKPFNWIIATGEPIENIVAHAYQLGEQNTSIIKNALLGTLLFLAVLFAIIIFLILFIYRKNKQIITQMIIEESKKDSLTNTLNRRSAEPLLKDIFDRFKAHKTSALILMLDLNNFHQIKTDYSKEISDTVIQDLIQQVFNNIRASDHIVRWSEEELMIVCSNLNIAFHHHIGEKILRSIIGQSFDSPKGKFSISVSIGSSFLQENDTDSTDVLIRAERAMRFARLSGKNRYINAEENLADTELNQKISDPIPEPQ